MVLPDKEKVFPTTLDPGVKITFTALNKEIVLSPNQGRSHGYDCFFSHYGLFVLLLFRSSSISSACIYVFFSPTCKKYISDQF